MGKSAQEFGKLPNPWGVAKGQARDSSPQLLILRCGADAFYFVLVCLDRRARKKLRLKGPKLNKNLRPLFGYTLVL